MTSVAAICRRRAAAGMARPHGALHPVACGHAGRAGAIGRDREECAPVAGSGLNILFTLNALVAWPPWGHSKSPPRVKRQGAFVQSLAAAYFPT